MGSERETAPRSEGAQADRLPDGVIWRDRLVELHVLAANGDDDAARAAQRWLSGDAEARRMWDEVEEDCHRVRDVP
jgi:hypothetical protein